MHCPLLQVLLPAHPGPHVLPQPLSPQLFPSHKHLSGFGMHASKFLLSVVITLVHSQPAGHPPTQL